MTTAPKALERLRYWQGQTLSSRDFNDQLAMDASLRWWHNRAIHDAYGEIHGFEPESVDGEVRVEPGLAYDCFGRELVICKETRLPVPAPNPDVSWWWLVLRAKSATPVPRPPVELVWLPAGPLFDPGAGVSLARGFFAEEGFELETGLWRRSTQAVSRPRLASGETIHGKTNWRPWTLSLSQFRKLPLPGIEVEIDTSAAGFQRTPCYFAWLRGDPFTESLLERGFLFVAFERIERATPSRFVLSLWLPYAPRQLPLDVVDGVVSITASDDASSERPLGVVEFARREISVCWLGIEAMPPSTS